MSSRISTLLRDTIATEEKTQVSSFAETQGSDSDFRSEEENPPKVQGFLGDKGCSKRILLVQSKDAPYLPFPRKLLRTNAHTNDYKRMHSRKTEGASVYQSQCFMGTIHIRRHLV